MKNKIFNTNNDWAGLITRLSIGLILFPHGAQQMLGTCPGSLPSWLLLSNFLALSPWLQALPRDSGR
jgi:hypothetical protein